MLAVEDAHGPRELTETLTTLGVANLLAERYQGLLPGDAVQADHDDFARQLAEVGIRHEHKPIPFDPRPFLIERRAHDRITGCFARLFPLIERATELYLSEPAVAEYFSLAPRHDRLIRLPLRDSPQVQVCRFDFTLDPAGQPQIYELNTNCPASATFSVHYARLAEQSRVQAVLDGLGFKREGVELEQPQSFAAAMLASAARNGREVRTVAVLNSRYATMITELDHIAEQFRHCGVQAIRCFVEDLDFDGDHLRYQGQQIDLTYNKFDDTFGPDGYECAFSRTSAEVAPYLEAYRAGAMFSVNGFASMYLPEQKSMLAFLRSELFGTHCTEAERQLIEEIVPETHIVRHLDDATLRRVTTGRQNFVLKRSLDTRGRTMLAGHSVTEEQWRAALDAARSDEPGCDWVLQRRVPPVRSLMRPIGGGEPVEVFSSLACFLFTGRPVGLVVRTSTEQTTNVGRMGFMQPPTVVSV